MGFQSTVAINIAAGVPGEMAFDAPWKAETYTINSATSSLNIIGATCCSVTSQGYCAAGNTTGALPFAGFLVDPKDIALFGVNNQPLSPTLTVPNQAIVECMTMGTIYVTVPAACAIGDYVIFDNVTGAISTITPSTPLPSGKSFANALVDYFTPNASGVQMAVISINPTYVIPQPA